MTLPSSASLRIVSAVCCTTVCDRRMHAENIRQRVLQFAKTRSSGRNLARYAGRLCSCQHLVHQFAVKNRPRRALPAANVAADNARVFRRPRTAPQPAWREIVTARRTPRARPPGLAGRLDWLLMKDRQCSTLAFIIISPRWFLTHNYSRTRGKLQGGRNDLMTANEKIVKTTYGRASISQ